jgi:hypothetical protein
MARFPARPIWFELDEGDPQAYECFGESHLLRWTEQGRAFQAHVYGPRRRVEQALGILDSFQVTRQQR